MTLGRRVTLTEPCLLRCRQVTAAVLVAASGALSCSAPEVSDNEYLLPVSAPRMTNERWIPDTNVAELSVVEHFIPPEIGRIAAVSLDSAGRLVVYDPTDCRIHIFAKERRTHASLGRCGAGPGDLGKAVVSVDLVGDTLRIVNNVPASIAWMTEDGKEVRRLNLPSESEGIAGAVLLDDTSLVIAPTPLSSSGGPLLKLVDSRTGDSRKEAISMAQPVIKNPDLHIEYLHVCRSASRQNPSLFVMQQWLMQTVELSAATLDPLASHYTATEADGGVAPTFPGRPVGKLRPRFRATGLLCTDLGVASWAKPADWESRPPRDLDALLELRSHEGRLLYRGGNPTGVKRVARPVAAQGAYMVFASNDDIPELWVVKAQVRTPGASSSKVSK